MKLKNIRMSNFKCFGPVPETISFEDTTTIIIGPNGSGKTAILQALSRMFSTNPGFRRIRRDDFHVPNDETTIPDERSLFIEADFVLPEACVATTVANTIPPCFNHMRLGDDANNLTIRYRLEATIGPDGDIEEGLFYVIGTESDGELKKKRVSRTERNHIAVHYLPAKRDPEDQIQASTTSLLGRIIRAVDWSEEEGEFSGIESHIRQLIGRNSAIQGASTKLSTEWKELHKGSHFCEANLVFGVESFNRLRDNVSVEFTPAHASNTLDSSLLSDGQKSLLYLSLVISFIEISRSALRGQAESNQKIDLNKLNPPVFSLIAVEEPENSLSPHYLGRINTLLKKIVTDEDAQAIITTHSPSMLKRVPPERIRYTRIGENRIATVKEISLPPKTEMEAYKFIREGILSNPEVYFSRFVVLGEGASEDIVLPKLFEAAGLPVDENGITIAQLGGRHVNYMWKLLNDLQIPYATLLDLDLCRYDGGWGRIKYAAYQLIKIGKYCGIDDPDKLPKWEAGNPLVRGYAERGFLTFMEQNNIFYSQPLDLDFSMIQKYPAAYGINTTTLTAPDDATCKAVLGKSHAHNEWYSSADKLLFDNYHKLFKVGSKPAEHISALSNLELTDVVVNLPQSYTNLIENVRVRLAEVYE